MGKKIIIILWVAGEFSTVEGMVERNQLGESKALIMWVTGGFLIVVGREGT